MPPRRTHVYGVYGVYSAYRYTNRNTPDLFRAHRPWIVGYRGTPLPKTKGKDKQEWALSNAAYWRHRRRLDTEFDVMRCLATPYLDKEAESAYITKYGTSVDREQRAAAERDQCRMPGKAKVVTGRPKFDQRKGNVGNLLHTHRSIEDSLGVLTYDRRYE